MIYKILYTAIYITGYGAFFILSLDYEPTYKKAWLAFIIPFLLLMAVWVYLWLFAIWYGGL